jgi:hypothetical protein
VDLAFAAYKCFGKAGLQSEVFKSLLEGLIGLAIKRDPKTKDLKKRNVAGDYFTFLQQVANDIEKMKNNKLPEYEKFFIDILKKSGSDAKKDRFKLADLQAMINKFDELSRDKEIESIERPIAAEILESVCNVTKSTAIKIGGMKLDPSKVKSISSVISTEEVTGMIVEWNSIADLMSSVIRLVDKPEMNYREDISLHVNNTIEGIKSVPFKLRSLRLMLLQETASMSGLIPQVKNIDKSENKK